MSWAVIFTCCVPVQRGDCLDKPAVWGCWSVILQRWKISVLGDFQNSSMQGAENPDLTLEISML